MKRPKSKAITLRNLPEGVARIVRERAAAYHLSLNQAVIQLLEERMAPVGERASGLHHDFDKYAGLWSAEQAEAFDRSLAELRRVDPELWR
jgi:hypothetical protein